MVNGNFAYISIPLEARSPFETARILSEKGQNDNKLLMLIVGQETAQQRLSTPCSAKKREEA